MSSRERLLHAAAANPAYFTDLEERYAQDPTSLPEDLVLALQELHAKPEITIEEPKIAVSEEKAQPSSVLYYPKLEFVGSTDFRIFNLIEAYRKYGHLDAQINPIATHSPEGHWNLSIEAAGFTKQDLSTHFPTCGLLQEEKAPLLEIVQTLRTIYCGKIGLEYIGIQNPELEIWIQQKFENPQQKSHLSIEQKKLILEFLNKSELFENFLHTKYTGQKRFSLEGGETLIPMLAVLLEAGVELGVEEFLIGMAHRGRLNVLASILNKSYSMIFSEFEDNYIPESFEGSGDVKYHKGFSSLVKTVSGKEVNIILIPNPSHLEAVDPVVEGIARAKQTQGEKSTREIVPVLIHGDAAISGQGVVYETLQLSRLEGYATGGTIHIVINNQIGFTTLPRDLRSTPYCTDIAHAFGAPVFHVNAEEPEVCVYAIILAMEIRQKFKCDVFIDLNCYRKYGHNESDEPAFTQPTEYKLIASKRPIRELYRDYLIEQGIVEKRVVESLESEFTQALHSAHEAIKADSGTDEKAPSKNVSIPYDPFKAVATNVPENTLWFLAERITDIPSEFKAHRKLVHLHEERKKALASPKDKKAIDWGTAEILAYASLLNEGTHVRFSGQDVCRGTFSHRHATLVDQEQENKVYIPLQNIKKEQGLFEIYNSPLSEYGVLGFDYGYSIGHPEALTIWEAQFGDFANGAQVIIDQFIATAEQKWGQKAPITLFLPHGYEGQGSEHSSGRIERFLNLSGNDNWQIVYPTTPAQHFHLLRRQVHSEAFKPLVVFTPKGLLRYPKCQSSLQEFLEGKFQFIIEDPIPQGKVTKLLFCAGRVYYDIISVLEKEQLSAAIVRIEQLYPLNSEEIKKMMSKHADLKTCLWVQEEPANMGAWDFIHSQFPALLPKNVTLKYIGRERSASSAAGSHALHKIQQDAFISELIQEFKNES